MIVHPSYITPQQTPDLEQVKILVRALGKTLYYTGTGFAVIFIVGCESYLRHEKKIKRFFVYTAEKMAGALRVPAHDLSPKLVRIVKAKARKAVA